MPWSLGTEEDVDKVENRKGDEEKRGKSKKREEISIEKVVEDVTIAGKYGFDQAQRKKLIMYIIVSDIIKPTPNKSM